MNDVESAKSIFNEVVSLQKPILQDKEFLSNRKAHVAVQSLMEQTQADALLGIGEVALAKGQFLEAEESFTPAIDLTDKYFDYHGYAFPCINLHTQSNISTFSLGRG